MFLVTYLLLQQCAQTNGMLLEIQENISNADSPDTIV
jgi:hypothetical protein